MTIDDTVVDQRGSAMLAWVERVRNELRKSEYVGPFLGVAACFATGGIADLHGHAYIRGGATTQVAYVGALLVQLLLILAIGAVADRYVADQSRARAAAAIAVGSAALGLALLPVLVSTRQPLTVFLFVVVTLVYDAAAGALVALVRPWTWLGRRSAATIPDRLRSQHRR